MLYLVLCVQVAMYSGSMHTVFAYHSGGWNCVRREPKEPRLNLSTVPYSFEIRQEIEEALSLEAHVKDSIEEISKGNWNVVLHDQRYSDLVTSCPSKQRYVTRVNDQGRNCYVVQPEIQKIAVVTCINKKCNQAGSYNTNGYQNNCYRDGLRQYTLWIYCDEGPLTTTITTTTATTRTTFGLGKRESARGTTVPPTDSYTRTSLPSKPSAASSKFEMIDLFLPQYCSCKSFRYCRESSFDEKYTHRQSSAGIASATKILRMLLMFK